MRKQCPKCKTNAFIDEKYCRQDGAELVEIPTPDCPECGKRIYSGDKFCGYWGKKLR